MINFTEVERTDSCGRTVEEEYGIYLEESDKWQKLYLYQIEDQQYQEEMAISMHEEGLNSFVSFTLN